jgi:hypothetical protein
MDSAFIMFGVAGAAGVALYSARWVKDFIGICCEQAAFRLLFAVAYGGLLGPTNVYCDLSKYMVTCF